MTEAHESAQKDVQRPSASEGATIFDVDGTYLRKQLCVIYIDAFVQAGLLPRTVMDYIEESHRAHLEREGPFSRFIDEFVQAYSGDGRLKGIRVADAKLIAEQVINECGKHVHVFSRELLRSAQSIGMPTAMISGSPSDVVQALVKEYHVTDYLGTEWPHEDGRFTGGPQVQWCLDKERAGRHLAGRHGWSLDASVAIGDTMTDAALFRIVRYPICFQPNHDLRELARKERWAIVYEEKNTITILRADQSGKLHEESLEAILPSRLATCLSNRLQSVNW